MLEAVCVLAGSVTNRYRLVLEFRGVDFLAAIVRHIKDIEVLNRRFFFTGHLVLVCFEGRTRFCNRVYYPKGLDFPFVCYICYKVA